MSLCVFAYHYRILLRIHLPECLLGRSAHIKCMTGYLQKCSTFLNNCHSGISAA